jgi:hypothetical protein
MTKTALITFGCSWTFGVGSGYLSQMSESDYRAIAWNDDLCSKLSFRGLLSEKYGFTNINFSAGGSSNQKQFRLCKEFFISAQGRQLCDTYDNVIVLHGITATSRNELYSVSRNKLINFMFNDQCTDLIKPLIENFYNHDHEVQRLAVEMEFMNIFYKSNNIINFWFDTFNHHDYGWQIDNLIDVGSPRDLLSNLACLNGMTKLDNQYHHSYWKADSNRVEFLIKKGILNPISKHPTKQGHELIANIISQYLEKVI